MAKALNREATYLDATVDGDRVRLYIHANPGSTRHYDIDELTFWGDELRAEIGDSEAEPGRSKKLESIERALRTYYGLYYTEDDEYLSDYGEGIVNGALTVVRDIAKILGIELATE